MNCNKHENIAISSVWKLYLMPHSFKCARGVDHRSSFMKHSLSSRAFLMRLYIHSTSAVATWIVQLQLRDNTKAYSEPYLSVLKIVFFFNQLNKFLFPGKKTVLVFLYDKDCQNLCVWGEGWIGLGRKNKTKQTKRTQAKLKDKIVIFKNL